ncbi:DUF2124 domain-containing protein [Methanobrevibacter sp.]|uniref:DUF2124 domain-containing protein n=1 Tax=Methanobrevibacter sp. TaxID=66852 RepID=UPI0025F6DF4B|nr:DUF2124 domain-containing protein [Methanobrevibacter sp.]MBQ2665286.1 DUF2124 domain-containing protein [Methanobrevibacter sp.]
MENINDWKGINGQLVSFKKEVGDAKKITFLGSPGVCTPFAELLAYAVRDVETNFVSLLDIENSHQFEFKEYAMVLADEISDSHDSDVVVLLGGLSMPKYDVDLDELKGVVDEILKDGGKLIGVSFMDMFTKSGWLEKVDFDVVIDGTLTGVVKT